MKELSLHLLDVVGNSVKAGATLIGIDLLEENDQLTMAIRDNGCGMSPELLAKVLDPFTTTRTTRRVGLGLPLLLQAAEMTGGTLGIQSAEGVGTKLTASFVTSHLDALPMGDLPATLQTLVQGAPEIDFDYRHLKDGRESLLDTRLIRAELGPDIPLSEPEVLAWIYESVAESEAALG